MKTVGYGVRQNWLVNFSYNLHNVAARLKTWGLMRSLILTISILLLSNNSLADGIINEHAENTSKKGVKTGALSDLQLLKFQYCGKDSDCMEVVNGCCQCLQGDTLVAIAKDRFEDFKQAFNCENIQCPKEESNKNCTDGVVSCINNKCTHFNSIN